MESPTPTGAVESTAFPDPERAARLAIWTLVAGYSMHYFLPDAPLMNSWFDGESYR